MCRDAERFEVLAFDDRQPDAGRPECCAVLGGVQLATESGGPSRSASQRRKERRGPLAAGEVDLVAQRWEHQAGARDSSQRLWRDANREPARDCGRLLAGGVQLRGIVEVETARNPARRSPGRAREEQEADAAVNREDSAAVVDPDN